MTIRVVCIAPDGSQTTVEREVPDDWLQPAAAPETTETPESEK